jgi:hypothetical protein
MKNDIETMQRSLEEATAARDAPADGDVLADALDPETASLREAWLAFGQMLETASSQAAPTIDHWGTLPPARRWQWRLPAAALLAASVLVAIAAAWMLHNTLWQGTAAVAPEKTVAANHEIAPSKQARAQTPPATDEPQWDDSLDEQFAQVGWQMLCIRQNQFFRTDAFGIVQYQLDQLSRAIQTDSL